MKPSERLAAIVAASKESRDNVARKGRLVSLDPAPAVPTPKRADEPPEDYSG